MWVAGCLKKNKNREWTSFATEKRDANRRNVRSGVLEGVVNATRSFVVKTFHEAATRRGAMVQRSMHEPAALRWPSTGPDWTSLDYYSNGRRSGDWIHWPSVSRGSPVQVECMQLDASSRAVINSPVTTDGCVCFVCKWQRKETGTWMVGCDKFVFARLPIFMPLRSCKRKGVIT